MYIFSSSPIAEYENRLKCNYRASQQKAFPTLTYFEVFWGRVALKFSSCGGRDPPKFTEVCILEGLQGPIFLVF